MMRDLRNEMYQSASTNADILKEEPEQDYYASGNYVGREEFNRVVKGLERRINILESKLNALSGWDTK